MILRRLFEKQKTGFYVDVGAHHPKRFSNTFFFYKKGWKGINIDAMPNSMDLFNKIRPRDTNLEIPISDKKQKLKYYMFNEPALNGFSKELAEKRDGKNNYKIISEKDMETSTLEEIFGKHLPRDQEIDFLSVDVEGLDFQVLKSNNWRRFRPKFVLVEILGSSIKEIANSKEYKYLYGFEYEIFAKTVNTVIFRSKALSVPRENWKHICNK
ncbi:MAG: FkbM family methyltransferase [Desulfobacteraceae bacterium]|nr:FkbM family methyltransferase [Desulfobacteraceae bacterium]MBC2720689.1 FkbM family methyltransferase [Desulfobacteraceae bacterium]